MPEIKYKLTVANIPLTIQQGATFYQRWQVRYAVTLLPFPFFNEAGVALWKGRCMFRSEYESAVPALDLTTENGGVVLDSVTNEDLSKTVFYSLYITAVQTALLPARTLVYDIEFERISDGWVITPQKGKVMVGPEATK